jgi:hypothetical protein
VTVAELARVGREHVLRAVQDLASEESEATETASPDSAHRVVRGDRVHDAIEVLDRAYWLATGDDLADDVDPPSSRDCALLLRGLGFEVAGDDLPPLRFTSAATVGAEHSRATWALAARERLLEVAAVYRDSIDYRDLADFVQRRSLVRTTAHPRSWIGDVLARVASQCVQRREPLLTSLVVDAHGSVGASYATALLELRGEEPDDVDAQAARERLECHRRFGADLPPDGGAPVVLRPVPTPRRPAAPRTRATAGGSSSGRARPSRPAQPKRARVATGRRTAEESVASSAAATRTCPVHFTVIGPSGVCDFCD